MNTQQELPASADVVIIGGGVCGCFIARELARYQLDIILIEKGPDVCEGASKGNGGTIHSGVNTDHGTLKATLCIKGNRLFPEIAEDLSVPLKTVGSLIVATSPEEVPLLDDMLENGRKNGVADARIIGRDEIARLEPHVRAIAAISAPSLRIVCPQRLVFALADNAAANGVHVGVNTEATDVLIENGKVRAVRTNRGDIRTRFAVNAAGVYADKVAEMAGAGDFKIIPRKGEYYILDKQAQWVSRNIFPLPGEHSKGACIFPTVDGNNLVGPNSDVVEDREDTSTTASVRRRVFELARRLVPELRQDDMISAFAGIRPTTETEDFIIGPTAVEGFINCAGIQSPGLTAAPAIAEMIVAIIGERTELKKKKGFKPKRKRAPRFADCSRKERDKLIREDPRHAHIICRCEIVTEKEIVDAIQEGIGATTLNGVKFRTRAGMGRCQGGFCRSRVAMILARELGVSPEKVLLRGSGSHLFVGGTKDLRKIVG
ncbi:MAG: NAD(P)/FAD-dependent oxidoreductase [Planctomycetes bacterium]|nr:NAD(P)/FAD-dependent oxidoreductase [Planctomycetota bacterium]